MAGPTGNCNKLPVERFTAASITPSGGYESTIERTFLTLSNIAPIPSLNQFIRIS